VTMMKPSTTPRESPSLELRAYRLILMIPGCGVLLFALVADTIALDGSRLHFGRRAALLLAGLVLLIFAVMFQKMASARAKRLVSLALVMLIAVFLTLSLVEIVFRCWDPYGMVYYSELRRFNKHMKKNEDFAYIHEPGLHGVFQGVTVDINSEGLRWAEFQVNKLKGTRRLLVLGDSVVFGWGVEQDKIFPAVLQEMLDQRGLKWEVISAGVASWNTRTEFEWLKKRGFDYEPDVVLLYIVGNDIRPKRTGRTEVSKEVLFPGSSNGSDKAATGEFWGRRLLFAVWREGARYSSIVRYAQHVRRRKSRRGRIRALARDASPQWQDMEAALRSMGELCRDRGVALVAASTANLPTALVERIKGCMGAMGTPYRRLKNRTIFEYRNSRADGHPNAVGHRMMAEEMWTYLEPILNSEGGESGVNGGQDDRPGGVGSR